MRLSDPPSPIPGVHGLTDVASAGMAGPLRIAVLASGRGTNLQALLDVQHVGACDFGVVGVFSDRLQAPALERARVANLPGIALQPGEFRSREAFDAAMCDAIDTVRPDLVVCAGYLRVLTDSAVQRFAGRLVNIHPSLLPLFPGLRTHSRALAEGASSHGASVHYVIPALDAGPVIAQVRVAVQAGDTPAILAARVLEREHRLLVACVQLIAAGRVFQSGSVVVVDSLPRSQPLLLDSNDHLVEPVDP